VPRDAPIVPTISQIFPGADWHERECHDFFGLTFDGHKNLLPLLLPEDADFHPLIKEDTKRKPIVDLMSPGEVRQSTPEFEALFTKPDDQEGEQDKSD